MKKKIINYLAKFLLLNYQYKLDSRVRLKWVYENFINMLEKEDVSGGVYTYKQFRLDLKELADLFNGNSKLIELRVKNALYVLHLQERVDNNVITDQVENVLAII